MMRRAALFLLALLPCLAHPQGTVTTTPQSMGGVQFAPSYSGADMSVQIAAAFAANAGAPAAPSTSAEVDLAPGRTYTLSKSAELPHDSSAPFISNPVLDCKGATLVARGVPVLVVRGQNANNASFAPEIRNCNLVRTDNNGPVLLDRDRAGLRLTNVQLVGGNDCYAVQLTRTDGGTGYREQSLLQNVSCILPSANGIHVTCDGTGSCGYQYNRGLNLRYEFGAGAHAQIFFDDPRIFAANGRYETAVNTNGDGTTYLIRSTAGVVSTAISYNGESTSGNMAFKFGGGGLLDLQCHQLMRNSVNYEPLAFCHVDDETAGTGTGPYGRLVGSITHSHESIYQNGDRASGTFDNGDNWVRFHAVTGGFERDHGIEQALSCPTSPGQPNAWDSTTCLNELFHQGRGGWGFGPGFHDSSAGSRNPNMTVEVHGNYGSSVQNKPSMEDTYWELVGGNWTLIRQVTTPPIGPQGQPSAPQVWRYYSGGARNNGYVDGRTERSRGDGHVDSTQNGNTDSASFSTGGTPGWTGTCAPGHAVVVTNGLVTGCR